MSCCFFFQFIFAIHHHQTHTNQNFTTNEISSDEREENSKLQFVNMWACECVNFQLDYSNGMVRGRSHYQWVVIRSLLYKVAQKLCLSSRASCVAWIAFDPVVSHHTLKQNMREFIFIKKFLPAGECAMYQNMPHSQYVFREQTNI